MRSKTFLFSVKPKCARRRVSEDSIFAQNWPQIPDTKAAPNRAQRPRAAPYFWLLGCRMFAANFVQKLISPRPIFSNLGPTGDRHQNDTRCSFTTGSLAPSVKNQHLRSLHKSLLFVHAHPSTPSVDAVSRHQLRAKCSLGPRASCEHACALRTRLAPKVKLTFKRSGL